MPQQPFVLRDSTGRDTIWLDMEGFPALIHIKPDTPSLDFLNMDTAIARQMKEGRLDTGFVHKKITNALGGLSPSFLKTAAVSNPDGKVEKNMYPSVQLGFSASVLILFFAGFSVLFSVSRARLLPFFQSVLNNRKFKDYFTQENPGVWPSNPVLYLLQALVTGGLISVWLQAKMGDTSPGQFMLRSLYVIGLYWMIPLLRNGIIMILGNIFMIQMEARKHILISYLSHTLLFIVSLPIAIQMAVHLPFLDNYVEPAFYVCIGIFLVYQITKSIQNTPVPDAGALFYIFLYFCTLEILPLVLLYKTVSLLTQ